MGACWIELRSQSSTHSLPPTLNREEMSIGVNADSVTLGGIWPQNRLRMIGIRACAMSANRLPFRASPRHKILLHPITSVIIVLPKLDSFVANHAEGAPPNMVWRVLRIG